MCRICGNTIVLKAGYRTAKLVSVYSDVIYAWYGIDVELEIPSIYPKKLCSNCRRKLENLKKSETIPDTHLNIFLFYEHSVQHQAVPAQVSILEHLMQHLIYMVLQYLRINTTTSVFMLSKNVRISKLLTY